MYERGEERGKGKGKDNGEREYVYWILDSVYCILYIVYWVLNV